MDVQQCPFYNVCQQCPMSMYCNLVYYCTYLKISYNSLEEGSSASLFVLCNFHFQIIVLHPYTHA